MAAAIVVVVVQMIPARVLNRLQVVAWWLRMLIGRCIAVLLVMMIGHIVHMVIIIVHAVVILLLTGAEVVIVIWRHEERGS